MTQLPAASRRRRFAVLRATREAAILNGAEWDQQE
jgi:hypothetical protein